MSKQAAQNTTNQITEGVIWKQLLIFFFPILFGTFFQQLYNTADAIIVGNFVGTGGGGGPVLAAAPGQDPVAEAVVALQQLGYKPAEASRMAREAALEGDDVAVVIRKALQSALR